MLELITELVARRTHLVVRNVALLWRLAHIQVILDRKQYLRILRIPLRQHVKFKLWLIIILVLAFFHNLADLNSGFLNPLLFGS